MANELNIGATTITFNKSPNNITISPINLSITVNGIHYIHDQVTLSTTDTNLNKGNIGTIGFVYLKNMDGTNSILVGADGVNYPITLAPGNWMFVFSMAAVHVKSSAGTPNIEYLLIEA